MTHTQSKFSIFLFNSTDISEETSLCSYPGNQAEHKFAILNMWLPRLPWSHLHSRQQRGQVQGRKAYEEYAWGGDLR